MVLKSALSLASIKGLNLETAVKQIIAALKEIEVYLHPLKKYEEK